MKPSGDSQRDLWRATTVVNVLLVATIFTAAVVCALPLPASEPSMERSPIPSDALQQSALKTLKEVFGADAASAKTSDAKTRVAGEMLAAAAREPNIVNRYVLLEMARRVATDAGDIDTSRTAVERLTAEFAIDGREFLDRTLIAAAGNATGEQATRAVDVLIAAATERNRGNDPADAEALGKAAQIASRKSGRKTDIDRAQRALVDFRSMTKTRNRIAALRERVQDNPNDDKSLIELGIQLCENDETCAEGLGILAAVSDINLARLAKVDLATSSKTNASLRVGDDWWDYSESTKGDLAALAMRRAVHHYHGIIDRLEGIEKTRIEKRIATAARKSQTSPGGKRSRNVILHFDAAIPASLLGADNRPLPDLPRSPLPVSAWIDPENLGGSAKQAAADAQPLSVVHEASGFRAVRFNGSQVLISPEPLPAMGTLIAVVEPARPLVNSCFIGAVGGKNGIDVWTRTDAVGMFRVLAADGKPFHISTVPGVMGRPGTHVVTVQWLKPLILRINGKRVIDQTDVPPINIAPSKGFVFGAQSDALANAYSGLLCECVVYDVQLPEDVVTQAERTLAAKWRIAGSP